MEEAADGGNLDAGGGESRPLGSTALLDLSLGTSSSDSGLSLSDSSLASDTLDLFLATSLSDSGLSVRLLLGLSWPRLPRRQLRGVSDGGGLQRQVHGK